MDQKLHQKELTVMESSQQSILPVADKSCPILSTPVKKLQVHGIQNLDANFVSPTPEKTEETLNSTGNKETAELPEKYRTLAEFFDRMTTSLRLLNLRKQLPTFRNICCQVETLTGRKISYGNLAQIKFILPEAVQMEKILLHNKKTLSVEHDIKITLLFDVVEGHLEHSDYIALSQTFFSRLSKFVKHSEDYDVPEAELPEPFNRREIKVSVHSLPVDSSLETLPNINDAELLNPSHFPPSFKKRFSTKVVADSAKTELLPFPVLPSSVTTDTTIDKETAFSSCSVPVKHENALQVLPSSIKTDTWIDKETTFSSCSDAVKYDNALHAANIETPLKNPLLHNEITIETPDLSTPKRSVPTEDKKLKSILSQKTMTSSLFTKRSLNFLNEDDEGVDLEGKPTSVSDSSAKEEDTFKNDVITQSGLKAYQAPTSDCLSDIVETIYNVSRSLQCCFITKSELVYKVLVNNFDVERDVIEEQLEVLVNKVPDWIKVDPSGDSLYYINKGLDLKSITEMLT